MPKSVEGILSETFTIYKNKFLRLAAIVSIVTIPVTIVFLIINLLFPAYGGDTTETMANALISLLLAPAAFAASILMAGAVIHAVSEQYFNQPVNIGRAYGFAWRKLGDMFWAAVLVGLVIYGIFVATTIISVIISVATGGFSGWQAAMAVTGILILVATPPALYLGIIWAFMLQTAMLEGCGPRAALSHSSALVKRSWWRVLGIVLLLLIIVSIIGLIFYMPAIIGAVSKLMTGATTGFIPYTTTGTPSWTMIAASIGGLIGRIICLPFFITGMTLLYFDLRMRKQGYSLDTLAHELGLSSPSTDTAATSLPV